MTGRELTTAVQAIIDGPFSEPVFLVQIDFEVPVYAHTGIGNISYRGNTFVGVGNLGGIAPARETDVVGPTPLRLTLSGLDWNMAAIAKEVSTYGARATIYKAYRREDGSVEDAPFIWWAGTIDASDFAYGPNNTSIVLTVQHVLADLEDSSAGRLTDENQQARYAGDTFFSFLHIIPTQKLVWGGGAPVTGDNFNPPADRTPPGVRPR